MGRRHLIATGVTRELPKTGESIVESVERMVRLLQGLGYKRRTALDVDPLGETFRSELRRFCRDETEPDDLVVLYHTGHAGLVSDEHALWMGDTEDPVSSTVPTTKLAKIGRAHV